MQRIFEIYKNKEVFQDNLVGVVCGYTDSHLLLAIVDKTTSSFRKAPKRGMYVLPEFDNGHFRYTYVLESTVIKQLGNEVHL